MDEGISGNIKIVARDTVSFDGRDSTDTVPSAVFTSVEPSGRGNGGNIYITTGSLSITNRAQLLSNTEGRGNAGNVFVEAREQVSLTNSDIISEVTEDTGVGEGGDINIKTGSLLLKDGSALLADLENRGRAGDIKIEARDHVVVEGEGLSAFSNSNKIVGSQITATVEPQAVGKGGNIDISASSLLIDEGFVSTKTEAGGNAGSINITTGNLSGTNGGQIIADTLGKGNAGNVIINASDKVSFDGEDSQGFVSGAFSTVGENAEGNGGDISITAESLLVSSGAELTTSSEGSGAAGSIEVVADSIRLDNQATLNSDTTAGQGNIILDSQDLILRRGSDITTNATGKATGGNITIDTDVLAALENSDISANAQEASGGRVQIDAQGIIGTEFRDQLTPESDITASSDLGPEFSGIVEINTPDVELQGSLNQLSANFVSPEQVVAGSCLARRNVEQGSFVVTGTGGLPRSPYEAVSGRYNVMGVQPIQGNSSISRKAEVIETNTWKKGDPIQEAQGMVVTADGRTIVGTTPQLVALAKAQTLLCDSD